MVVNKTSEQENQLVQDNLGLVVRIAKSFSPINATELEEYIQVGAIGLLKAIRKHDPELGKLSTIAWQAIRWEILKYMRGANKHSHVGLIQDAVYMPHDNMWECLPSTLSDKEKLILKLKTEGYTFKDIGIKVGYTRGWVNRLYQSAIKKIKQANNVTT